MTKKIALVSNTSWYLHNFRRGLMRALKDKGFHVIALAPEDDYSRLIGRDFEFIPLKNLDRKGTNPLNDIKLLMEFYRLYKYLKVDLVFHFTVKPNIYGAIAAMVAGVESVNSVTGLGYLFIKNGFSSIIARLLYRIAFSFSSKIFFQNTDDRDLFLKYKMVDERKVLIVPGSGVDINYFSPQSCDNALLDNNKISFLLIARMLWDKGIREFVESAIIVKEKFPSAEFLFLGETDSGNPSGIPENIIRKWESEGIVRRLGSTDDVRPFICRSSVVVLPSYREGTPRSLLEAIAMKKPIITTNTVGCKEVCEDGVNGFLVPIKDSISLANSMVKMIKMGEEGREEMGKRGRGKAVREFDERIVIDKYLEVLSRT